jgi:pimeloyl-ACP methyl ester carboxylesterase
MKKVFRIAGGVVLFVVLLLGALVAYAWAPDRSVAELQKRWAPPPSVFVDVNGMQVHLRDEGPRDDAQPLVLLHGTGASLHVWEGWARELKQQRRVISFDLPGFGLTGPSPQGDYSMDSYVAFVLAVLDKVQVKQCVLVGNSFGGRIAWETAVASPERVARLVLVDASGYPARSKSVPIGFRIAQTPVLNKLLEVTLPRSMVESSLKNVYGDPQKVTPQMIERSYEITLREGNRGAMGARMKQSPTGVGVERIRQLKLPTLILWGGRDRLNPPSDGELFERDIVGSKRVVFDDLGHLPQEEDPARTLPVVQAFLKS